MAHLPHAGAEEDDDLHDDEPDRLGVGRLARVAEGCLDLTHVPLLELDVEDLLVELGELGGEGVGVLLVAAGVSRCEPKASEARNGESARGMAGAEREYVEEEWGLDRDSRRIMLGRADGYVEVHLDVPRGSAEPSGG